MLAEEPRRLQTKPLTVQGQPGVWFPEEDAERVYDLILRRHPEALETIEMQNQLIELQGQQIELLDETLTLTSSVTDRQQELTERLLSAYDEEISRNSGVLQEPVFWLVAGVALGGAAAGLTAWGAK